MAKQINARIITKHDTKSHWDKATSFKPKQGEIIVYEPESNSSFNEYDWNTVPRIKIGDGVSLINDLKFITEPYVRKEANKGLSSVNFTREYEQKIKNIPDNAVYTDTKYKAGEDIGLNNDDKSFYNLGVTSVQLGSNNNLFVKKRNGPGRNDFIIQELNLNNINKVSITEGTTNGTIKFNGTDIKVKGLGDLAYKNLEDISIGGAVAIPEILISENYADLEGLTNNIKLRYIKSDKNLLIKIEPNTFQTLSFLEKSGGTINGELSVNGSVTLNNTLSVTGATTLNNTLTNTLTVEKDSTLKGRLLISNTLSVIGIASLKGVLSVEKDSTLKGKLSVSKETVLSSTLSVDGDATLKGNLLLGDDKKIQGKAKIVLSNDNMDYKAQSLDNKYTTTTLVIQDKNSENIGYLFTTQSSDGIIYNGIATKKYISSLNEGVEGRIYVSINNEGDIIGRCNGKFYGAVYNDYAEYRAQEEYIAPGLIAYCSDDGKLKITHQRLQKFEGVVSDTYGFAIGQTVDNQTPLAVSGRVLVYCNSYETFHSGNCVCAGPDGKACLMTRKEVEQFPDRIVGIVSEIPEYEYWGDNNIKVNGRIWIKVK